MGTIPTSVRIDEDKLKEFKAIQASFEKGSDFAEWIINAHRLHENTKGSTYFTQQSESLMAIFKDAVTIFNSAIAEADRMVRSKEISLDEELRTKNESIENLNSKIAELKEALATKDEEIKETELSRLEIKNQLTTLKKELDSIKKELTTTYELNNMLLLEKSRYASIENKNTELEAEVQLEKDKREQLLSQVVSLKEMNENMQKEHELLEKSHADKIETIKHTHSQEVEHLKSMMELEVSKAVVEAQRQFQEQLEDKIKIAAEAMAKRLSKAKEEDDEKKQKEHHQD